MENCGAYAGLLMIAMIALLVIAVMLQHRRQAARNAARLEAVRHEAEEQFRIYQEAWAAARKSDNVDSFVRCGDYLIKAARQWQPHLVESVAWDVYKEILQRLKSTPDLKPVALDIGRAAYSARRANGVLTIYDEQAIQNDIFVHDG